jgi:hypothetical protein
LSTAISRRWALDSGEDDDSACRTAGVRPELRQRDETSVTKIMFQKSVVAISACKKKRLCMRCISKYTTSIKKAKRLSSEHRRAKDLPDKMMKKETDWRNMLATTGELGNATDEKTRAITRITQEAEESQKYAWGERGKEGEGG